MKIEDKELSDKMLMLQIANILGKRYGTVGRSENNRAVLEILAKLRKIATHEPKLRVFSNPSSPA